MKIGDELKWDYKIMGLIKRSPEIVVHEGKEMRIFEDTKRNKYITTKLHHYRMITLEKGDVTTIRGKEGDDEIVPPKKAKGIYDRGTKKPEKEVSSAPSTEMSAAPKEAKKLDVPAPPPVGLEQADLVEARDIANNSDLVLQYEAPFRNRKTGKTEMKRWLGTNAWKLGMIEGYIKKGYSVSIVYEDTKEVRTCKIDITKGEQRVHAPGTYTKSRLKSFLSPAKDECFDTFAFRNAIKRVVSLKDVVVAVKETQAELASIEMMPTKAVEG